ncbi:hypothetical protein [Actinosynnema sp. NPDC020468]|uniref:hypothetical protein n=1 Tax=Actinosynnema sp. NPDC020468 TaxID=3154488 RepID=UPI0034076BC7
MTVLDAPTQALRVPGSGWARSRGPRRVNADAAAARTSASAFAVAVADGIGDSTQSAEVARLVADHAVASAWRRGARAAVDDVRHVLTAGLPTAPVPRIGESRTVPNTPEWPEEDLDAHHDAHFDAEFTETALRPVTVATPPTPAPRDFAGHPVPGNDFAREPVVGNAVFAVASGDARGWSVAWVGDCRAYFVPEHGPAVPLTHDHTMGQYLRDRGVHTGRNLDHVVTTTAREGDPGFVLGPRGRGRLALVTDGLHRVLSTDTIGHVVRTTTDPAAAAGALIAAAAAAGTRDNACAVVVDLP